MRWLAGLFLLATPAAAQFNEVPCENIDHLGASYTVCEVLATDDIQLFLRDDDGAILGSFSAVENHAGRTLTFAMNAGMYHDDRDPVGHYIEDGVEEMRVITSDGPGNFGLLPNGVLCIGDDVRVYETLAYVDAQPACDFATQSGPMLVIDGALHPRFIPDGTSKFIRNGVGTSADGTRAVFAISNEAVNFHDFATLFRDRIGLPDALYFDGKVSRMYATSINRSDFGWQLGPIVGVLDGATPSN
ncbi:phosphodiester glycosidase family protein [Octadecabacter sp. G9-8]|uniref:Phosphodiester glycosidase family protein n=1 Tax=Octadecabacter dasysiphoniae TaxID=2909341 RepID=A0ABS9CVM1_9RHOB|nr:phosphodiester glycosidase family protein [Octadecabacter dasysiphoniae]MCF2871285.1 phosphodiester glycosidase family protein [Octadecabacter dasysiphoniae]